MQKAFVRTAVLAGTVIGVAAYSGLAQPAELTGTDIGAPNVAGFHSIASGTITVAGGGGDIWGASDSFYYAYMPVTGDFDYVVKVEQLIGNVGDGGWSKAELMARLPSAPDALPAADDPHLSNMTTRPSADIPNDGVTTGTAGVNLRGPQWRAHRAGGEAAGAGGGLDPDGNDWAGDSVWTAPSPAVPPNMPNNWMRLERVGSVLYMYYSNDGTTWTMYPPFDPQGWDTRGSWPSGTDNTRLGYFTNGWPSKLFVGLAVTAHAADNISTGVFSNFKAFTPVPIAITTQPPATKSLTASMPLELTIAATGDPVHYEWRKNGTPIPRQVSPKLTVPITTMDDAGKYTCRVFGGGTEVISSETVVTITVDTEAPTLVSARADGSFTTVKVIFSEPLGASGSNIANYAISPSLAISEIVPIPIAGNEGFYNGVKLTTAKQALQTEYTLTVNNVKDYSGNTIAADSKATFMSAQELKGFAFYERWMDNAGDLGSLDAFSTALDDTTTPVRAPDVTSTENEFNTPWGVEENYNSRIRTFFTPAKSGTYIFYISADDNAVLYLSTDADPANKRAIAKETGWSNEYQWTNAGSPAMNAEGTGGDIMKCSATWDGNEWGGDIVLTAGTKYYMEIRHNEGTGGDGAGATFIMAGEATPSNNANGEGEFLKGDVISWYESLDNVTPNITTQPVGSLTLAPGASAEMSVVAFGTKLSYQWVLNGKNIAGATSDKYTIANASLADIGEYEVVVSNPNGSARSSLCKVLVTATAAFTIEAEDFDYDGGKTKAEASVMPYLGGAYTNLTAVFDVDYHNTDAPTDSQTGDPAHPVYRYAAAGGSDLETAGRGVNIADNMGGQWGSTRGGVWTMTSNFKIGWISSGDWGNYTRTFPATPTKYTVFAAQSYDGRSAGQLNSSIALVTSGVGTTTQTTEPIGKFDAPGSAGWSQNSLVPLTDDTGAAKQVTLSGTQTIRWTYNSGDADYLLFIPETTVEEVKFTGITKNADGTITVEWTGGGTLQAAAEVTGPWQDVPGSTSPYKLTPTAAMTFGRIKK